MQQDDPRNIFYNQRQRYAEEQQQHAGTAQNTNGKEQQYFENGTKDNGNTQQQRANAQNAPNAQNGQSGNTAQSDYEQKVAEMKRLAAKYQREGEGQLVKDIVNSVIEQKAAGKLTNEQLIAFAKRISPMLNAEQRTRLSGLVEQLVKL